MIVWLNGSLLPLDAARIDPRDRGFTLGDGLYETIRVRDGAILRLDRHFARLAAGLRLLDIRPSYAEDALADAMAETIKANGLSDAALRLTVSRGPAARGLAPDPAGQPTILIAAAAYSEPTPVRAVIATVTRRNEHSPLSRVKSTNCLDSVLARLEAARRGADEAILLNTTGRVAEATAANLFATIGGDLVTPGAGEGALLGIVRALVIERAGAVERALAPEELAGAAEIFLTSSLGVRPVTEFDGRPVAAGPRAAQISRHLNTDW